MLLPLRPALGGSAVPGGIDGTAAFWLPDGGPLQMLEALPAFAGVGQAARTSDGAFSGGDFSGGGAVPGHDRKTPAGAGGGPGGTDFAPINSDLVDKYKKDDSFKQINEGYLFYISVNFQNSDLANLNVRKAISLAINRKDLCENVSIHTHHLRHILH